MRLSYLMCCLFCKGNKTKSCKYSLKQVDAKFFASWLKFIYLGGHDGHDRMIIGFTTTYAIIAYHH
jgi:hypothetical protein